ncbi:PIN domain-containing protein [Candidatus Leptofilum sp.]|uniref:PIN domain-containing protein n=1 Tax=Candidatus Leptofilum sp. TaxID=3241576 RepID=UPI003B594219
MIDSDSLRFVDANIWLCAFVTGQDEAKSRKAQELVLTYQENLVISTQVINEVCVNLLRKAGMQEESVRKVIHAFYRRYKVHGLEDSILITASALRQRHSLSYWDSLIVAAALFADASVLYSEDMQDGLVIDGRLTIKNPF